MIAHLPLCLVFVDGAVLACNCGADGQNDLARRLDALPPAPCLGCAKVRRHPGEGYVCAAHPDATPPTDTPLRAAARMLDRLHARACHHDSPRHLLATAYAAADLAAATLDPAEAIRVLDGVEPEPAGDGANASTR